MFQQDNNHPTLKANHTPHKHSHHIPKLFLDNHNIPHKLYQDNHLTPKANHTHKLLLDNHHTLMLLTPKQLDSLGRQEMKQQQQLLLLLFLWRKRTLTLSAALYLVVRYCECSQPA